MSTQRKQIRNEVITRLSNANVVPNGNVFSAGQFRRLWKDQLPAVVVYARDEQVGIYAEAPREYDRKLQLVVEVIAAGDETLDDTLDDLCQKVEEVLDDDHTLGEKTDDVVLKSIDLSTSDEGDQMIGGARLTFEITYSTVAVAITEADLENLDTFQIAHVAYQARPGQNSAPAAAEDTITLDP